MPIIQTNPVPPKVYTVLDIIQDAYYEIGWSPGENLKAEEGSFGMRKFNDVLDQWAARNLLVYNKDFATYPLTPNHQPHTIGPSNADFNVPQRPVKIENASLVFNTSVPSVRLPLSLRDDDWWADKRIKELTSAVPTDLYYSQTVPNGSLFLWPVPTVAYGLELETWVNFGQAASLTDTITLPQGYRPALIYAVALNLADGFGGLDPAALIKLTNKANKALSIIITNNAGAPRISTTMGLNKPASKGHFDWRTGGY